MQIPGQLLFSGKFFGQQSGTLPGQPRSGGCVVLSILPKPCASSSATKRAGGERRQKKGIGKAGEEINGSVQEE